MPQRKAPASHRLRRWPPAVAIVGGTDAALNAVQVGEHLLSYGRES
jgi:hypothetical protein